MSKRFANFVRRYICGTNRVSTNEFCTGTSKEDMVGRLSSTGSKIASGKDDLINKAKKQLDKNLDSTSTEKSNPNSNDPNKSSDKGKGNPDKHDKAQEMDKKKKKIDEPKK